MRTGRLIHGVEGSFVGEVVAEVGDGRILAGFCEDLAYGAAFVASDAEFEARFKFEERDAFELSKRFKESAGALLNLPGSRGCVAAPMHDGGVWLVFIESAEGVLAEKGAECIEPLPRGGRCVLELAMAGRVETLGTVEAPNFNGLIEREHGCDFLSGAAGNDGDARAPVALNALELLADTCPGARLKAVDAEPGERAIVIEQEQRTMVRLLDLMEEAVDLCDGLGSDGVLPLRGSGFADWGGHEGCCHRSPRPVCVASR